MVYRNSIPSEAHGLTDRELALVNVQVAEPFRQLLADLQVDYIPQTVLNHIYIPLAAALAKATRNKTGTLIVGVNGAQGSGKTTLCSILSLLLESGFGLRVTSLSIDDLYLTRGQRDKLSKSVHPLLATRGVPGTHDVELGLQLLKELQEPQTGRKISIPVFDKSIDDRLPQSDWRVVETPLDIVLFEGWCVGATPQATEELLDPVNRLEEIDDADGLWRNHLNSQLATDYARLFATLDLLLMLEIPNMESVFTWRGLQEKKLAAQSQRADATQLMDKAALQRFIMHYERLTRHMLAEMPERANLVLQLNSAHQVAAVRINSWPATKAKRKA
jgi:D-glycerate 3-kinase